MTQAANLAALGTNAGTTGILPAAGGGTAGTGGAISMKNRLINGNMVINQRAWSGTITADSTYTLDRWVARNDLTSKMSVTQSSDAPAGFSYSLLVTSLSAYTMSAGGYYFISQYIEGYNVADLGWGTASAKTVTLSFWVKSSLTGTFGGSLVNADQNRSYPFTYTISSANTWQQISITITGETSGTWNTTNGTAIRVSLEVGIGTTYSGTAGSWASTLYYGATGATSILATNGATLQWTGVQLEVGTAATNFDFRSIGTELGLCQRYFVRYGGTGNYEYVNFTNLIAATGTDAYGCVTSPVSMRTVPSYSYSNLRVLDESAAFAVTYIASSGAVYGNNYGAEVLFRVSSGLVQYRPYFVQTNGGTSTSYYLYMNAEL